MIIFGIIVLWSYLVSCITNGYKREIGLAVLDAARGRFAETQEFIDSTLKEECVKEKMTADEVSFCF